MDGHEVPPEGPGWAGRSYGTTCVWMSMVCMSPSRRLGGAGAIELHITDRRQPRVRPAAPTVDRFRSGRQRPRRTWLGLRKLLHAEAVFECQSVRVQEVEEHTVGGDVTTGPEHDGNVVPPEPVERDSDVVDLRHHEVQVMQSVPLAACNAHAVVVGVRRGAHEGDDALDVVRSGEREHPRHEVDGLGITRRCEHDVADALDLGHAWHERWWILRGVGEVELESRAGVWLLDPPSPQPLIVRNNLTCDAALLKSSAQCFEGFLTLQRERHRTEAGGRRFMQDHLAVVRAAKEFQRAVDGLLVGSLQADKVFVEATRAIQIGDVQVNASQPLISNHGARLQGNESMQPGCERLSALRGHGSRLSALRSDEEQVLRRKLDNGARRLRKVDTVSISHAYIRRRWRARRSDMEAQAALV